VVSVTAQLGTLPLCLAYFHQFPVYFLLTNFVVVPLTGLIVWGSVVLWMSSPVAFLFTPAAALFRILMHLLNGFVREVESWPGSVLENINFSAPDGLFYLVLFFLVLSGVMEKKRCILIGVLMTATVWSGFNRAEAYVHRKREVFLVYRSGENTLIQWIRGRDQTVFHDPGDSPASREKTIQRARWALKVKSTTWVSRSDTSLWKSYGIPESFNLEKRMASLRTGVFYNPDNQSGGSDGIRSHRSTLRSRDAAPR
jgi:competence protein ComEC